MIFNIDQAVVGDGDTMRVAAHVVEHVLGFAEWSLGVNHPFDVLEGGEVQTPFVRISQFFERTEELEFAGVECLLEVLQKQAAEQAGQDIHGQEKARPAVDPSLAIG